MFDRPDIGQRVVLLNISLKNFEGSESELCSLAQSAGLVDFFSYSLFLKNVRADTFLSKGHLETLTEHVLDFKADLVILNQILSPSQERNLEHVLSCRVFDRVALILDIFAQRAQSYEGKLQVELAQLDYLSTRLIRGWTHLERQKGGIGLRGPGETQLETDRRLLRQRIKSIEKRLIKISKTRLAGRQFRKKNQMPSISLVGYTNAGKSTLFNVLTESNVYVQDQLFATLDPVIRRFYLNSHKEGMLIDTVGFIQNLPHSLIRAFRSTLEETIEADLLLHVVDVSSDDYVAHIDSVQKVLLEIEANTIPMVLVFNKVDLLDSVVLDEKISALDTQMNVFPMSSQTGDGVSGLIDYLNDFFAIEILDVSFTFHILGEKIVSELYSLSEILEKSYSDDGFILVKVRIEKHFFEQLLSRMDGDLFLLSYTIHS